MKGLAATLLAALMALSLPNPAAADGEPSAATKAMAGAKGTFVFKPRDWAEGTTTWWKDTDGVDPGTAGCHIGTDSSGEPNGRKFGEACLDDGLLVETNPGTNELHSRADDVGQPDKFDCNAWCVGQRSSKSMCVAATALPCLQSARCACE